MSFRDKFLSTPGVIEVAGRRVKCYHVSPEESGIDAAITAAGCRFLPGLVPDPDAETPPGGFAVFHRAGPASFLNAYSWVWGNAIECHIAVAGIPLLGCPDEDPTNFVVLERPWIGCVWELAVIEHERSAWVAHVLCPDTPDLPAYLADICPAARVGAATP